MDRALNRRVVVVAAALLVIAAGASIAWRSDAVQEAFDSQSIIQRLETVQQSTWAPLIFVAAFIVGGLVMFPVTAMSATTALVFPPLQAAPISLTGMMASAALMHWLGARFFGKPGRRNLGKTLKRLDDALHDRSIITIATLRMMPIAPFSLVNLAAGAAGIRRSDYLLGSLLGFAPGVTMVCLFGRQVRALWKNPSASAVMTVVAVMSAWILVSLGLQLWIRRRRPKRGR